MELIQITLLVLRDGVRLKYRLLLVQHLYHLLIPLILNKLKYLKGPASVLYGTDAIGGVIQLVSKTPEKTGAFVTGEMGENKTYKSVIGADLAENGFYAQIRGQRLETDGTLYYRYQMIIAKLVMIKKAIVQKLVLKKNNYAASVDYSRK